MTTDPRDWPYREPASNDYETDAAFRSLVDALEAYIHNHHFSPAEVRAAGVLAVIHFELRRRIGIFEADDSVPEQIT